MDLDVEVSRNCMQAYSNSHQFEADENFTTPILVCGSAWIDHNQEESYYYMGRYGHHY